MGVTERKKGRQEGGTLALGDGRESNMEEKRLSKRTVGRGPLLSCGGEGGPKIGVRCLEHSGGWGVTAPGEGIAA